MRLLRHRTEFSLNGTACGEQVVERTKGRQNGTETHEFVEGDFGGEVADQCVLCEGTPAEAGKR